MNFIGRRQELEALNSLLRKGSASLVVLKGRRRIGKSRLVKEFAKNKIFYEFSGIPPEKNTTAQEQRDTFAAQLETICDLSHVKSDDWTFLLSALAKKCQKGQCIILLDEISWMGSKDPTFLGKLKNAWDKEFSQNPQLVLVLCGSISTWIEKNIITSTGFVGRPSLYMTLGELPLSDCNQFWNKYGKGVSAYEKLKLLSVIGGVPRYLELMDSRLSAEENIKKLCLTPYGPLVNEFDYIFTDIFSESYVVYKKILIYLADHGPTTQEKLSLNLGLPRTGNLSMYLHDLILSGLVSRDFTWHLKTGEISKLSTYRLKDSYIRFYLKYIEPNKPKIEKGTFHFQSLSALPGWDGMMGLQFENLVVSNHRILMKILKIQPQDLVFDNPFFQRKTARQAGCQIDYLIQTRFNTIYVCEIKFSRFEIGPEVIQQVQNKINNLSMPRHLSYRPVLIHVNGVREDVVDSGFFAEIIDFSRLLEEKLD